MADNFNLRAFLTENKLTKNAQLLKEEQEGYRYFEEEGNGGYYLDTVDGHKIYSMEDSSVMDTCFYAIIDPDGNEEFVGIDVAGEPISSEELQNEYELQSNIADFIEADINAELGDELDENKAGLKEGTDISGYWVMYGGLNKGVPQFIKMFPSEEEAQQALQDAPTTYGQHVLRGNWGIQSAQDWLASGKELGPDSMGHPDRVPRKRLSPEELAAIRQLDFDAEMEREGTQNKKPIMKETNLTAKERRLVEMVNSAMGYTNNDEDQEFNPGHDIEAAQNAIERQYEGEMTPQEYQKKGMPFKGENKLKYESIEELMKEIEHGTDEAAHNYKMEEMKRVYEALEDKVSSLEEGEHAEHIDQKAVKQMRKDIATLRKAEEKLRKEFDKKFSGKEKKETPAKEKAVEALQEGFNLRKFLAENRK